MFLDVRDPWPPVPPPGPLPQTGKSARDKRTERIIGLIVACNLALLLFAPVLGTSVVQVLIALIARLR